MNKSTADLLNKTALKYYKAHYKGNKKRPEKKNICSIASTDKYVVE